MLQLRHLLKFVTLSLFSMKRLVASLLSLSVLLSACGPSVAPTPEQGSGSNVSQSATIPEIPVSTVDIAKAAEPFANSVAYKESAVAIDNAIAQDFAIEELKNLKDMEKAYGAFTAAEKKFLSANKFLVRDLPTTAIKPLIPTSKNEIYREFWALYNAVKGGDVKDRRPENSIFYTTDFFFHAYSVLFVELLKEMENIVFFPAMKELSATFYKASEEKLKAATSEGDKEKWRKVRNYFVVPHAIFSTVVMPEPSPYGGLPSLTDAQKAEDKTIDSEVNASAFVKKLNLDSASEKDVLADLHHVFDASTKGVPEVFKPEYEEYARANDTEFMVDFTQFTPRSHYTSSSLRRQYFRGMNWYIQVPFFVKSPKLTEYAFAVTELFANHAKQLKDYGRIESTINFLVGTSDDLMPIDYLQALETAKGKPNREAAIMDFLIKAHPPKIKSLAAAYPTIGEKESSDVLLLTKGMRLFSGKFIIDSYWTGMLTQGDEAPRPGYTQKLPPMASSLEVMGLLGSDYARTQISSLDFYKPETKLAIDQAMRELTAETEKLDQSYWTDNIYHSSLWAIRGLFAFEKEHHDKLPRFMQSALWPIKTLQTASGFWTEMRHATLLYAKQSFAELGGGAPCDPRKIPDPAKGYVEPNMKVYDRLEYLANRTHAGLESQGYSLQNLPQLKSYALAVDKAREFSSAQFANTLRAEKVIEHRDEDPFEAGKPCIWYELEGKSAWEDLRLELFSMLENALPIPVEGAVLPPKDRRAAVVADIHTGGDTDNPTRILYEGMGVPKVIFVAVKDGNGARLTVGFTYAHHEFTELYGGKRMTDEQWQERFYKPATEEVSPVEALQYTDRGSWPAPNPWYLPILRP